MGAFGDGDEHDIHNSDAADDEGNTSNKSQHTRYDVKEGTGRVSDLIAIGDGVVFLATFANA